MATLNRETRSRKRIFQGMQQIKDTDSLLIARRRIYTNRVSTRFECKRGIIRLGFFFHSATQILVVKTDTKMRVKVEKI